MPLTSSEYELVSFIEQEYLLTGEIPTKEVSLDKLAMSSKKYDELWKRDDFRSALLSRGISIKLLDGIAANGVLSAEQMLAINTLLDINDNRSDTKKLRDLGINTATYQGWCRDPVFQDYLRRRTELIFGDSLIEANRAIYDNVKRGDLGSIKLLFEMTGRWSSKPVSEMNIEWILMKVIETIQRHVTDPETLSALAADLGAIQEQAVPVATGLPPGLSTGSGVPARVGSPALMTGASDSIINATFDPKEFNL